VLSDRYRIEQEIGQGGMATVFRAFDLRRNTFVAIKAPRPELVAQLGVERFAREVQISTQLQHPHIVPVFDSGTANGVPYYVMPLIEGETLEQKLRRDGPLPIAQAIDIACELAEGLAYAHTHGFIHRDVKPANVLLSNGHALLADFGIARAVERADASKLTESGFALGTADYMSPEQASGDSALDGRSDIYGLACVLYEMLAGAPPFSGATSRSVMARHFVDPVPSLRTVRDTVPEALEEVIVTAMAKAPVDRYQNAEAFRDALRDPTLRQATVARAAVVTAKSRRTRIMAAAAALVAVAGAGAVWKFGGETDAPLDRNRVMVYPFVLPAGYAGPATIGEDVATIIGSALDAADPLRWVDGWALLDEKGRADVRTLTYDSARRLARSKRCATFMTGRLVAAGDSVKVFLTLHDVRGDSVLAQGEGIGIASDPWKQGLTAVSGILPQLIPGSTKDVSAEWKNRAPGAVANFLLGESAFRRVQPRDALDHYRKAIALDSTFALAALRGAQAASWNHNNAEASAMIRLASAQTLPPRYKHFAMGMAEYINGRADSAAAHLRQALAADPEMVVAWTQLGEVYTHLLPLAGNTDSLADLAFSAARRLDTTSASILLHPIEIRLRRGDTAGVTTLLRRFNAERPDSTLLSQLRIGDACVRGGVGAVNWTDEVSRRPLEVLRFANWLGGLGAHYSCGARGFESILAVDTGATDAADGRRFAALLGAQGHHIARGDFARAASVIDATAKRWSFGESIYLLAAPSTAVWLERAKGIAKADEARYGPNYATLPYPRRLWELGVLEARTGRVSVATAIAANLRTQGTVPGAEYVSGLARSIDAFLHLARGDSLAAEKGLTALILDGARGDQVEWEEASPHGGERLLLAQLLMARKEYQQAMDVASVFDSPKLVHLIYLRPSLELRARAARALGNSRVQAHYLARLAVLRTEARTTP